MKYLNFMVLRKILDFNNRRTKAWYLKTATVCSNAFGTQATCNKELPYSESESFVWLKTARNGKQKAEDLIPKIITSIQAQPSFFECVNKICYDLKRIFPTAEVKLFGSAGSNLALKNADIDVELYFYGIKISADKIHTVKRTLRKSNLFTSVEAIFARVPIVKCVHRNGVSCDISVSEHLGPYDNELIKFILSIDNRIRPLILILKFLLRRQNLLFNTHSFVVLTLFLLQIIENPLVPPISYLQDAATERKMINGWDASFTKEISKLPKVNNQLSVIELLHKFFEFYAAFEFAFHVISTFTAKFYLKPVFANVDLLPEQFHLYKRKFSEEFCTFKYNAPMCLQGFFNHSTNISKNIRGVDVRSFQEYCRINAALGQELLYRNEDEEHKVEYLIKLFQNNVKNNPKKAGMNLLDVTALQNVRPEDFSFQEGKVFKMFLEDFNLSVDELRKKWWKHIFDNILEILTDVMDCKISVKSHKLGDESHNLVEKTVISCEMFYTELGRKIRKQTAKDLNLDVNLSPIAREKIITDYLKKTAFKNVQKHSCKFDVICELKKNPTLFCLKFNPRLNNDKFDGIQIEACLYTKKRLIKWMFN